MVKAFISTPPSSNIVSSLRNSADPQPQIDPHRLAVFLVGDFILHPIQCLVQRLHKGLHRHELARVEQRAPRLHAVEPCLDVPLTFLDQLRRPLDLNGRGFAERGKVDFFNRPIILPFLSFYDYGDHSLAHLAFLTGLPQFCFRSRLLTKRTDCWSIGSFRPFRPLDLIPFSNPELNDLTLFVDIHRESDLLALLVTNKQTAEKWYFSTARRV